MLTSKVEYGGGGVFIFYIKPLNLSACLSVLVSVSLSVLPDKISGKFRITIRIQEPDYVDNLGGGLQSLTDTV